MKKSYAEKLIKETKENYNNIAPNFSKSRRYVWKSLSPLFEYLSEGDKVLDLGCGNGRLYEKFKQEGVSYTGVDFSGELIEIAQSKYPQGNFKVANALSLPFSETDFDKVYSIATFHHIPSKAFRKQFLGEVRRVLKPEGLLILTVWKVKEPKRTRLLIKFTLKKLLGFSKLDFGDILVPWEDRLQRYIHDFSRGELGKLIKAFGFKIKKVGFLENKLVGKRKNRNIFVVAQKQEKL